MSLNLANQCGRGSYSAPEVGALFVEVLLRPYDFGAECSGYAPRWDRGDSGTREFIAFYVSDDKVVGALNANVWDVTGPRQALIAEGRPIDDTRVEDPGVPLADVHTVRTSRIRHAKEL